jgi:hypothetical protein
MKGNDMDPKNNLKSNTIDTQSHPTLHGWVQRQFPTEHELGIIPRRITVVPTDTWRSDQKRVTEYLLMRAQRTADREGTYAYEGEEDVEHVVEEGGALIAIFQCEGETARMLVGILDTSLRAEPKVDMADPRTLHVDIDIDDIDDTFGPMVGYDIDAYELVGINPDNLYAIIRVDSARADIGRTLKDEIAVRHFYFVKVNGGGK